MKALIPFCGIMIIGAVAFVGDVSAQDSDIGKVEYQTNCASCHGIGAKGDGPMSSELKRRPSDLTILAKRNNGVFPLNSVYRIIDGRDEIAMAVVRCPCGDIVSSHQNTSI
jgi:mono/diheme cytochrome c family protein